MNWRRIIAAGTVAGMIAITGCSTSLPETNQGNRNGQRVVDAANRRPDTYSTTRNRGLYNETGRITRGIRRGLSRAESPTRNHNVNRSLNIGRPDARIGTTYRAPGVDYGRTHALDSRGFDTGVTTTDSAIVNSRANRVNTQRSTALPKINHNRANAGKMAGDVTQRNAKPTRSTAPKATHNVTRSTAPKTTHNTGVTRSTTPKATHNANVTRSTAPKTTHNTKVTRNNATKTNTVRNEITNNTHNSSIRSNHVNPYVVNHPATVQTKMASRYGMNLYQNRAARRDQEHKRINVSRTGGQRKRYNEDAPKNMNKTVAVMNSDDDMAFFKKKAEPEVPAPQMPAPEAPTTMPAPRTMPAPVGVAYYDDDMPPDESPEVQIETVNPQAAWNGK
ncbi:MAG: hypothetical protein FWC78_01370 [Defluviitaleaceae bacterium]|nr:hypothetical protein [Defluviitaleaceae bacterium]